VAGVAVGAVFPFILTLLSVSFLDVGFFRKHRIINWVRMDLQKLIQSSDVFSRCVLPL
jgi:hypothetical protein